MQASPKYNFTLIHGTFSARADWVNQDETRYPNGFRARLKSAINAPVEFSVPPPWGSTSLLTCLSDLTNAARLSGAQRLKQHILDFPDKKNEKHYLLAHSHGGNIALYAMQDPQVKAKIDGIICMATPFLFPRLRPLSIKTLILSLAIMIIGVMEFIWAMNLSDHGWFAWSGAAGLLVTAVVIPAFLVWIVSITRYKQKITSDHDLSKHIELLSYKDPGKPVLLIRSSGDEASGLLRGIQFLNWVGGVVMRVGGRQLYTLLCIATLAFMWVAYSDAVGIHDNALSVLSLALIISSGVMVIMLMALTLSRVLIGLDAWRWVGELETMIEDGPPGIPSELLVITPRQPKQGLSHTAVYTEPETTQAIASWCQ